MTTDIVRQYPADGHGPELELNRPMAEPTSLVLVIHGGRANSFAPVRPGQLAVLRMVPFANAISDRGHDRGVAVFRLRNRVRGWNDTLASPLADVGWALAQMRERFGDLPMGLLGHSLGGRAALAMAGTPGVAAVVGLAPWLPVAEPVAPVAGRKVLLIHGGKDHMTDPDGSADFVRRASGVADQVGMVTINGDKHPMLRRWGVWHQLSSEFLLAALGYQTMPEAAANAIQMSHEPDPRYRI